ncbi:MAG: response regulator transcription factor [Planctomycetes bacterium]|nr:response regulator transcription factor [Planctomycetota bacterium]
MATPKPIVVVEDDPAIRRGLVDALRIAGYGPIEAADGREGLAAALSTDPVLVLLDVMLPSMDGFSVLAELRRAKPRLPILLVTARGAEEDRVRGLLGGADDYVVKPFSARELLARIEAVLRRSAERPQAVQRISIAGRKVDFERRELALASGERRPLSEKEAELLRYLASAPDRAVTREELLRCIWGLDPRGVTTRTVDMHVVRLREKLGDDAEAPAVLVTVRSKGYMLGAFEVLP